MLRPPSRTCHFRVFLVTPLSNLSLTGWELTKKSSRIDFITTAAKSMRQPAFLGLKTNLQNYQSSDVWLGGLDRFHCFRVKVLASKWGCLYGIGVRKMVCRSGVYYGLIAEYCLGEVLSQEREQWFWAFLLGLAFSQSNVQRSDLNGISF